ncbi:hypothetical protein KBZ20_16355 [Vulcanococcus limneticus Candia 3F8]|uniref:hypothetical protein n=1 Tax=Vulcanococcus limneticus TaxID=2170428 RepID=UPI0020CD76D4|nr:hypothetical protein [Vulcanococcus limneticus]MCP9793337.1 hypothetical protein [Vulcanococcus limneticus MW73D5]MCP9895339.1 hypothetical protein [Vulcanococcus limneticus Candia 3F8]MCP9898735.1 hypothetical protein [Vulcanococcus limneticus Candia 3B3]
MAMGDRQSVAEALDRAWGDNWIESIRLGRQDQQPQGGDKRQQIQAERARVAREIEALQQQQRELIEAERRMSWGA